MNLFFLFLIFFYIGLFAIGGGLVAATFMQQVLVEKYALISSEKFYSMLAISESTPGPIGINLATYIGTELYGPIGGIVTTLGEVLPSFIVIIAIARFFAHFQDKPAVKSVFATLRPATSGMVLIALVQVFSIAILNPLDTITSPLNAVKWPSLAFYAVCLAVLFLTKLHPVFIVVVGAVFGVLFL